MTPAAQPLTTDAGPLSPWWTRAVLAAMRLGFTGLYLGGFPVAIEPWDGAARRAAPA